MRDICSNKRTGSRIAPMILFRGRNIVGESKRDAMADLASREKDNPEMIGGFRMEYGSLRITIQGEFSELHGS